jgi:GT2 family glycosyltransferase
VENASREFSADEVARLVPGGHYVRSPANLGFAGGCNLGARESRGAAAAFALFLNNDCVIAPDALAAMVRVAETDPAVGIVGAKILQAAAPGRLESVALRVDRRGGRVHSTGLGETDCGQYEGLIDVTAVSGAAMLVRRALWERLGGFDERYFAYFEDVDLCLRARRAGWTVRAAPRAVVWHKGLASTGGVTSADTLYYATRNNLMLMAEYGRGGGAARAARSMYLTALHAAHALHPGRGSRAERLRAVSCGVRDYGRGVVGPWPAAGRLALRTS